ncbi:MAG: DMT family transporter [Thermoplasmata archaeon]
MAATGGWSWSARGLFLLVALVWGFNFLFVKSGLDFTNGLWLAFLRAGSGSLAVAAILTGLRGWGTLDARGRRDALLIGLPNTAAFFALFMWATSYVLPGYASVLVVTFPLWVAVLSVPVLHHRLGRLHWVSVAVAFVGVGLFSEVWAGGGSNSPIAILELLGAAVAWAIGTVLFQRRFRPEEALEANAYQLFGGTGALLVATLVLAPYPLPVATPGLIESVLFLGVLGTAMAYPIWFHLLVRTRAATLSAYVFLVPLIALLASAVFYHERLAPVQIVGVALVLASIYGVGRAQAPLTLPPSASAT